MKIKLKYALFGIFFAVNLAAPFLANSICTWLKLPLTHSGFIVSVHEFLCSIFTAVFLYSVQRNEPKTPKLAYYLPVIFLLLGIGDMAYGLDYYLLNHIFKKSILILTHELPYIFTMALLAGVSISRSLENSSATQRKLLTATVGILSLIYFVCSYKMVLSYQFPAGYNRPTLNYFTSYTYGVFQSLAMGGLLVASLRTEGTWEFLLWFLFISMNGSDFALRLQDVGKLPIGTPMFEYGWEVAVAGLSILSLYQRMYREKLEGPFSSSPRSLESIRVLIPLSALGIIALFISLNFLLSPYFQIANVNTVSGQALIFAFTWVAANGIGIALSRVLSDRISALNNKISAAKTLKDIGNLHGNLVELNPIISSLHQLKTQLGDSIEENLKMRSAIAASSAAAGVAHNIRSPLASLEMGVRLIPNVPEKAAGIINQALSEMRGILQGFSESNSKREMIAIASSLTSQRKSPTSIESVAKLLETSVRQKQLEYKERTNVKITLTLDPISRCIFSKLNRIDFSVVISNLVNNAVEAALPGHVANICISLSQEERDAIIRIKDNGKGISPDHLSSLGSPGVSLDKPNGSGFGLFHARTKLQQWGGSLQLSSTVGEGTEVTLAIPLTEAPSWFASQIEVSEDSLICIIDDDTLMHSAWGIRLESLGVDPRSILHFYDPVQYRSWHADNRGRPNARKILHIVDYEFKGSPENGLDLIESTGIADSSLLVTGHSNDSAVIHRCQWLGVKLLPKDDISNISITDAASASGLTRNNKTAIDEATPNLNV